MIKFKAKIETVYNADDTVAWRCLKVPKFTRKHCDMNYFRRHEKFGGLANSDLFEKLLSRQTKHIGQYIRLDRIPDGVTIDDSGFLAVVTINI